MSFEENKQLGFFQVARSLVHDELWTDKPAWWLKVWIYLLSEVNHKDYSEKLKRGSGLFTYSKIYQECNLVSESVKVEAIDNLMRFLKKTQKIATQKTTRGFIVIVLNYNLYQTSGNFKNDTVNETKTTQERHRNDTINKNEKNEKNERKEKIIKKEKDFNPLTPEQLADIAIKLKISLSDVEQKHDGIVEMWESGDFEARYPKHKTLIGTLRTWLRMDIQRGNVKEMSQDELEQLKFMTPESISELEKVSQEVKNGLHI